MRIDQYLAPFKREVWEHQTSFVGVFAALGGLLIILLLFVAINGGDGSTISVNISFDDEKTDEPFSLNHLIDTKLNILIVSLLHAFVLISTIVTVYYQLGSLYDDRKDRSILFWKSLPISETQTVITKFLTGVYIIPIFALVIGVITSFILSMIFSVWLPMMSDYGFIEIWGKFSFISGVFLSFVFIVVTGIWISPFCAWLLFASAASKRSPLMLATLPPILIVAAEKMFVGKSYLLMLLDMYRPDMQALEEYDNNMSMDTISALIDSFIMGPQIFVGLAVTGLLLAASVWLRNNRYEI